MGNMTKNCKEMNFLNKKKNPQTDENAKKEKSDIPPIINENNHKNNNSNHDLSPCNLEQKFNEKNFTEKDFENSFCSIPDVNNIILNNSKENDLYFSGEDLEFYKGKFKDEEMFKASKKNSKSKKIRWKEGEQLGMGSFGRVVLGFNKEIGELMAVKQVHLIGFSSSPERIKALEIEFNLLSQLKHKNIVRYIGTTKNKETFNIFLEFVAGGSISSLISKFGSLKENIVRLYTKQILEGLEYLHWNNVLHRDIKGANVLVDNNGVCKLADFGSAKRICGIYENERYHSLSGTANWMAPEVIRQTGSGRFADIWSVGCTVVEMLTGKAPFSEYKNPISAMFHIAKTKSPPSVPVDLTNVTMNFLENCFKQIPKERFNVRKLLSHPFITGQAEIIQNIPTLDITKEKEKKILENFENQRVDQGKKEQENVNINLNSQNSSLVVSQQIILMTSSENNTIILKTLKKEKITEEKKKNIEKSPPHLKFNTQEDQEFGSLERRSSNSKDCEELKGIQIIVQNSEINLVSDINTIEEHILNNNQS